MSFTVYVDLSRNQLSPKPPGWSGFSHCNCNFWGIPILDSLDRVFVFFNHDHCPLMNLGASLTWTIFFVREYRTIAVGGRCEGWNQNNDHTHVLGHYQWNMILSTIATSFWGKTLWVWLKLSDLQIDECVDGSTYSIIIYQVNHALKYWGSLVRLSRPNQPMCFQSRIRISYIYIYVYIYINRYKHICTYI